MSDKSDSIEVIACNRQPFLSDEGCDRGDVNIFQFDDLPFCDPISPTDPGIPPEVVDSPMFLTVPPPCSCINIDHSFKFEYGSSGRDKKEFKSRGDCCEGNYTADFLLHIPCPLKEQVGTISASVSYGSGGKKEVEFARSNKTDCSLDLKSPELDLQIPCPVSGTGEITASISYGDGDSTVTKEFAEGQGGSNCNLVLKSPELDLQIPCPIGIEGEGKITASIAYGNGDSEKEVGYVNNNGECDIVLSSPEIELQIPCPVQEGEKVIKLKKVQYKSHPQDKEVKYIEGDNETCKLDVYEPELEVEAPCPLTGLSFSKGQMSTTDEAVPSISFHSNNNGCDREIVVDLSVPNNATLPDVDVITDMEYTTHGGCILYKPIFTNLKTGIKRFDVDWSVLVCFESADCSNMTFDGVGGTMKIGAYYL